MQTGTHLAYPLPPIYLGHRSDLSEQYRAMGWVGDQSCSLLRVGDVDRMTRACDSDLVAFDSFYQHESEYPGNCHGYGHRLPVSENAQLLSRSYGSR